ncbi:hypothetical protein [Cupriavidus sp.]|uniref:hypothetical protein n=1 Tax=Cupriavidus sp. TaxID=1873897 RepID=UPI0025C41E72|nr:hypothetical protein [Cupriavidus sp.]MCA3182925.1 hypothetical protein [Cupriavidus sp.]MCA3189660.1 hypothetical protein [Cupriavidus sp.]MCA3195702.1 hypothetical protein [Cupriavidus sp.]MCA3203859.1 hypothetical protein [Cupriavidus sp.]MCA3209456.1 hypothetical protein [Cupriavidus sp.]
MVDPIYHKTEAGQEEIRTRARKLDQKLRALLLIVNGERAKSALMAQVGGLGVAEEAFDTLLALGLIEPHAEPAAPASAPTGRTTKPSASRKPADTNLFAAYSGFNSAGGKGIDDRVEGRVEDRDVLADTTIAPAMAPVASSAPAGADGYKRLYHFYTDVIGNHLGLRGYVLQVKVEKASTVVELAALRDTLGTALQKAKGEITAHAIVDQLDDLLAEMGVAPAR